MGLALAAGQADSSGSRWHDAPSAEAGAQAQAGLRLWGVEEGAETVSLRLLRPSPSPSLSPLPQAPAEGKSGGEGEL